LPTAVELCLPWRRNTGREPVSSVKTHMVPDGSDPVRADGGTWMKGVTHSMSDSQSDSRSQSDLVGYDQLGITVDEENADQSTPLCSPNFGAVLLASEHSVPSDEERVEVKVKDIPAVLGLPPCRKNSRHSETPMQLCVPQPVTRFSVRHRPTRCGSFPSSMDAAYRAIDREAEATAATALLPWRYTSNERAIPDQQAPRPLAGPHAAVMTKDSPSQSFVDAVSTYPQVSCQSFRLSEAESRHSEPVHVQHVIDVMPAGHRVTSATSDSDDDQSSDILCSLEELNSHERICMWLDTLSETNDEVPPELNAVISDEFL